SWPPAKNSPRAPQHSWPLFFPVGPKSLARRFQQRLRPIHCYARGEGWTLFASRITELTLLPFFADEALAAGGNPAAAGAQEEQRAIAGRGNAGDLSGKVRIAMDIEGNRRGVEHRRRGRGGVAHQRAGDGGDTARRAARGTAVQHQSFYVKEGGAGGEIHLNM